MRIGVDDARKFWMHPTQHDRGVTGEDLPAWADYWADGPACIMTYEVLWPGVISAHIGVLPEAWGSTVEPVKRLLSEIWTEKQPERIIAHIKEENRLACRLVERVGATIDGKTPVRGGTVLQYGWTG